MDIKYLTFSVIISSSPLYEYKHLADKLVGLFHEKKKTSKPMLELL